MPRFRFIALAVGGCVFLALLWACFLLVPQFATRARRALFEQYFDPPPARPLPSLADVGDAIRFRAADLAEQADDATAVRRATRAGRPAVAAERGRAALQHRRPDAALAAFDAALRSNPRQADALRGRAAALIALGRLPEAMRDYERLETLCPAEPRDRFNHAVALCRAGRLTEAADQYRIALRLHPDYDEAIFNLATVCQQHGQLSEAVELWQRFTARQPGVATAWFNLGVVQSDLERFADAAASFEQAVQRQPDDGLALLNAGMTCRRAGRPADAVAYLERAQAILPDEAAAPRELVEAHLALAASGPGAASHRTAAIDWARRALARDPNQPALQRLVGDDRGPRPN